MLTKLKQALGLRSPIRLSWHFCKGFLAYHLSGYPARGMTVIGVTGTKGKTTTSTLIAHCLNAAGHKVFLFTTAAYWIGEEKHVNNFKMTNDSPFTLWRMIRKARKAGCTHIVLETSSHGIYYFRNFGIKYDASVLTNITQDHLDLHGTMEHYANTKRRIFSLKGPEKFVVLNRDSDFYETFASVDTRKVTYSVQDPNADYAASNIHVNGGLNFELKTGSRSAIIQSPLMGLFNVSNILAAQSALLTLGINQEIVSYAISQFGGVPGRLEMVPNNRGLRIVVDYAHTEASLEAVLETLHVGKEGRMIVVFGATGDRDTTKRPKMGQVADRLADVVILTDDDPYTEDPKSIVDMIAQGVDRKEGENYYQFPGDRRAAIQKSLEIAESGDIVLLAGKGSENALITNDGPIPWNDRKVTEEILMQ